MELLTVNKIYLMRKILLYTLTILTICNLVNAQSSLPECKGNDENISEYSTKHFRIIRKWTNCHGTAVGPWGGKYVGEFYDGKFHGQGIFTKDGRKYFGEYKKHKRHGKGTYIYANGDKYVGEWIKHKYTKGTYVYANGDIYVGDWKKKNTILQTMVLDVTEKELTHTLTGINM